MKIPNNFEILSDSKSFEDWLNKEDTNEVLSEIGHAVDIHYSLYFKDCSGLSPSYYAHPLLKIIYSYWLSCQPTRI